MNKRHVDHFDGKKVVITGGSSGIGYALAERILACGSQVIIVADQPQSVCQAVSRLSETGLFKFPPEGIVCDVGSIASVAEATALIESKFGAPDILINNAGFALYQTFEQEEPHEIERLISVNFMGAVRVTKSFLAAMVARKSGQIVNVASIAGVMLLTPSGMYCAAKHALVAWSECIAVELERFGISVTVVCPGRVETNFFAHESFKTRRHRKETEMVVPLSEVVDATLDAIVRHQRMRFVPRWLGFASWVWAALNPLARLPYERLLRGRVEDLYRKTDLP